MKRSALTQYDEGSGAKEIQALLSLELGPPRDQKDEKVGAASWQRPGFARREDEGNALLTRSTEECGCRRESELDGVGLLALVRTDWVALFPQRLQVSPSSVTGLWLLRDHRDSSGLESSFAG